MLRLNTFIDISKTTLEISDFFVWKRGKTIGYAQEKYKHKDIIELNRDKFTGPGLKWGVDGKLRSNLSGAIDNDAIKATDKDYDGIAMNKIKFSVDTNYLNLNSSGKLSLLDKFIKKETSQIKFDSLTLERNSTTEEPIYLNLFSKTDEDYGQAGIRFGKNANNHWNIYQVSGEGKSKNLEIQKVIKDFKGDDLGTKKVLTINSDTGHIGINQQNPVEKLHIGGSIKTDENLFVNNQIRSNNILNTNKITSKNIETTSIEEAEKSVFKGFVDFDISRVHFKNGFELGGVKYNKTGTVDDGNILLRDKGVFVAKSMNGHVSIDSNANTTIQSGVIDNDMIKSKGTYQNVKYNGITRDKLNINFGSGLEWNSGKNELISTLSKNKIVNRDLKSDMILSEKIDIEKINFSLDSRFFEMKKESNVNVLKSKIDIDETKGIRWGKDSDDNLNILETYVVDGSITNNSVSSKPDEKININKTTLSVDDSTIEWSNAKKIHYK
mgnify:FL=1